MSDPVGEVELYEGLARLLPAQFAEVCLRLEAPREYLGGATQAEVAIALVTWARQEPSRLAALRRELERVTGAIDGPPEPLFKQLCGLTDAQFEEVVVKVGMPRADLPGDAASLVERAAALLRWVQQRPAERRPALVSAIDDVLTRERHGRRRRLLRVAAAAVVTVVMLGVIGWVGAPRLWWERRRATFRVPPEPTRVQVDIDTSIPLIGRGCDRPKLVVCITDSAKDALRRNTMSPTYLVRADGNPHEDRYSDAVIEAAGNRLQIGEFASDAERRDCVYREMADAWVSRRPGWRLRRWVVLINMSYPAGRNPSEDFRLLWRCNDDETPLTSSVSP